MIRAAADASADDEIVIVGSQAILAQFPDAPEELLRSQEADLFPRGAPATSELIDGAIGDGSAFHQTYGYYAHGVGPDTAKAPAGWEDRLVPVRVRVRPGSRRVITGWCLEAHDLVLSKCVAGRERDWEFAEAIIRHRLVASHELLSRVGDLPVDEEARQRVTAMIRGIAEKLGPSTGI